MNSIDLKTDSVLDSSIRFKYPLSKDWSHPKTLFLTGATGFVGVYLLEDLLQKTKANIYCLIRGKDEEEGRLRLNNHLKSHGLWQEKYSQRIIPVIGDLSKTLFGWSEQSFQEMAGKIDAIYHSGALVNFVYPYSVLKAPNVIGTQEVIRLSSLVITKPVHFISSVAVFFSQSHFSKGSVQENDIPICDESLKGGYKQSKWVAEQLVMHAQERGMPACIYRPVRILGASTSGIIKYNDDSLCHLLKACIEMKKYPTLNTVMTFVPVDYVGQTISYLSMQEKSINKAFHLTHPSPISWKAFVHEILNLGYDMEEIPYDKWLDELLGFAAKHPENKVYSFLLLFLKDSNNLLLKHMHFDSNNTQTVLNSLLDSPYVLCPPTDTRLISTYLSYFQKSGYIKAPDAR